MQKPVKIPKFKVGDFIQFKGMGHTRYTIKEVCGLSHYINSFDRRMDMSYTDNNFELVEQKPAAWSEEDEYLLDETIKHLEALIRITKKQGSAYSDEIQYYQRDIDWLKSLKERCTWKPSNEQLKALKEAVDEHFDIDGGALWHLYEDLKKLKD